MIITFLFLAFEYERLFENPLPVNRSSKKISYRNNILHNGFNNFNTFLTIFYNSSGDFMVCTIASFSEIFNENQLTGFSMIQVFTVRHFRAGFHFSLDVNVDVTVVSYMNSNSCEIKHDFLPQWIDLIIYRTMKPETTKLPFLKQIHIFCFFIYILLLCSFEAYKHDMRLAYLLIVCIFLHIHLYSTSKKT